MTLGPDHYVPVLKVKQGEKEALSRVDNEIKRKVMPLLEIVERGERKARIEAHLETTFRGLAESLAGYSSCFIDVREIEPDGASAAMSAFARAQADGIPFVPVTGLRRVADVQAALAHRSRGIAIRLTRNEFEEGNLAAELSAFVRQHGLALGDVDLVLDLGEADAFVAEGLAALGDQFLREVPNPTSWRTLIISGCAFPLSMREVDRNSHDLADRTEWVAWRDNLYANRASLPRLPVFSDCVIQHPRGVEGFNPKFMKPSASVRYKSADQWLLIKGESTGITVPSVQFPKLAQILVYGHLKSMFRGQAHCNGCASMKSAADGRSGLGSAGVWRRLGTIHHITSVVEDLQGLSWP